MTWQSMNMLIALGLIGLNACFVLMEFALVKVRSTRLEVLARKGDVRALLVQGMLKEIDVYLSAIQMGITMTSLGLGWIGEPAAAALLEGYLRRVPLFVVPIFAHALSFAAAFGVITFLHILLGELVPRSVGLQKSEVVALWTALPLKVFTLAFKPPIALLANASIAVLRLLRMPPVAQAETPFSEEEMRVILGSPEERTGVPLERLMLLENIFDFGASRAADAMVPADKVAFLSLGRTWEENLETIRSRRFSRYPLCRQGLDSAVGYVHVKDILLSGAGAPDLAALRRSLIEIQEDEPLQRLLRQFADKGVQLAVVRDPLKKAAGIVALEDILEELVGEIHDEFDLPRAWSLMDALVPAAVEVGLEAEDRRDVIRRLLARLEKAHPELELSGSFETVWARELKFSSAMGHGIALPHGRLPGLERSLVAVGRAGKAFPFQPPDKLPVRLVFLILTPAAQPVAQIRILSRVATLLSNDNLRRRLLRARSAEHLVEILKTADTVLAA